MKTVEFTIPTWAAVSLLNSDTSCISKQEEQVMNDFICSQVTGNGFIGIPVGVEAKGFAMSNDMTSLGDDVSLVTFQASQDDEDCVVEAYPIWCCECPSCGADSPVADDDIIDNVAFSQTCFECKSDFMVKKP
jgi:hypothetical protein